jgi:hypothetical protein
MPIAKNGHYVLHSLHGSNVINWIKLSELLVVIAIQSWHLSHNPNSGVPKYTVAFSFVFGNNCPTID